MRSARAIASNDLILLAREPGAYVVLLVMPSILVVFLNPVLGPALRAHGYPGARGPGAALPGLMVMFTFFAVTFVGYSILDERRWHTLQRLRLQSSTLAIVTAKAVMPIIVCVVQQLILLIVGVALWQLDISRMLLVAAFLIVPQAICVVALGMAVAAVATSARQISVAGNVSALVFGGLGGALTPVELLPSGLARLAPLAPSYWAIKGMRTVLFGSGHLAAAILDMLVLFAFGVAFVLVATALMTSRTQRDAR